MNRREFNQCVLMSGLSAFSCNLFADATNQAEKSSSPGRPNILWLYIEDMNPFLSCYGTDLIQTPHMDKLADNGVLFERAFVTTPVCSPCRSTIITGAMATTTGAHNHNSSYRQAPIYLPEGIKTIPEIFREKGYYTFNCGKTHYNFVHDLKKMYSKPESNLTPWRSRESGQPFFGQIQLGGGKSLFNKKAFNNRAVKVGPQAAAKTLPPYYPKDDIILKHWAWHYDCVKMTDDHVGRIMTELEADGLLENTFVFCFSDHGCYMPRHKQFCYEGGLHVPLIISCPGKTDHFKPGTRRKDLISGLDIPATAIELAGLDKPKWYEGFNVFAKDHKPREHVIATRDRCDFTIDRIRSVRTADNYKYIRNFMTDRPYTQPQYRDGREYMDRMRKLYSEGKLTKAQAWFWAEDRPTEELYDLNKDPHETINLAKDPVYADQLKRLRGILENWIKETDDKGQYPESVAGLKAVIKHWKDRCVNPEYEKAQQ